LYSADDNTNIRWNTGYYDSDFGGGLVSVPPSKRHASTWTTPYLIALESFQFIISPFHQL